MERKIILLVWFVSSNTMSFAQTAYDRTLKSIYNNTVPQVKANELRDIIEANMSVIILDTRSREEFEVSHIPGSVFIDYDHFEPNDVSSIDRKAEVIVYCSVGARSEKIGEKLLGLGFSNVRNLYGGIFQWVNEGGSVLNKKNLPTDSVHTYSWLWSVWLERGIKVH